MEVISCFASIRTVKGNGSSQHFLKSPLPGILQSHILFSTVLGQLIYKLKFYKDFKCSLLSVRFVENLQVQIIASWLPYVTLETSSNHWDRPCRNWHFNLSAHGWKYISLNYYRKRMPSTISSAKPPPQPAWCTPYSISHTFPFSHTVI